jgi:anti-anti-sigma factor
MPLEYDLYVLPSGYPVLAPVGELDLATAEDLEESLAAAARLSVHLTVDMSSVPFIDCTALTVLLRAHRRAFGGGGGLMLVDVVPLVRRLLTLTQIVDNELAVYGSVDDAVAAWQYRAQRNRRRARTLQRQTSHTAPIAS